MSYSFAAKGDTKDAALADATRQYDNVVMATQPVHSIDREMVLSNLRAQLALVREPAEGEFVSISMHGSISTSTTNGVGSVSNGCCVSVTRPYVPGV